MNSQRIIIGSIICLVWWINEILSNPLNEQNMTEIIMMPFTINANPINYVNITSKIPSPVFSTPKPPLGVTERNNKIEPTTEAKLFIPTVVGFPKNHKPSFQPHTEPGSIEVIHGKHQKWQIPSPIQFTTPNPKETNSSKRQILTEKFNYAEFVPSREIGSYDNTEGFVPKVHQPKTISFLQNILKPNIKDSSPINIKEISNKQGVKFPNDFKKSPPRGLSVLPSNKKFASDYSTSRTFSSALGTRNKNNKKKTSSGNRKDSNRRQGLMEEFQKDFDKLVGKYPELGDLINEYPVMEEIMKQKLTKVFQNSDDQRLYSEEQYNEGDEGSEEEDDDKLKFNVQALPLKFTNYKFQSDEESNVNIYGDNPQTFDGAPYPFDGKKPSWSYRKKPNLPTNVPAGGYYQNSKFPDIDDHKSDHKHLGEDNPLNIEIHERPPISPWKRAIHMLTAFLPVGLLISALTPNIININNSSDQAYTIRQRSADGSSSSSQLPAPLREKLQGKFQDLENLRLMKDTSDNPICDDWNFCEMAKKGSDSDAVGVEKIFWQLAHEVPEHIAEKNGMKKLFKAIKSKDCSQFPCKVNVKPPQTHEEIHGKKDSNGESSADIEGLLDNEEDVESRRNGGNNSVKRDDILDGSLNFTTVIGVF